MVRNYASAKLMQVARRYVKKFGEPEPGDEVVGYTRFAELCSDLDAIVNVLWLSGTRKIAALPTPKDYLCLTGYSSQSSNPDPPAYRERDYRICPVLPPRPQLHPEAPPEA